MINLLITSGDGPAECRLAVAQIERLMAEDAQSLGFPSPVRSPARQGPRSPSLCSWKAMGPIRWLPLGWERSCGVVQARFGPGTSAPIGLWG